MKAGRKKKTLNLDGGLIDQVRRLFNARTETEAINRALRKALDDREVEEALDAMLRKGRFRAIYH